VGLQVQMPMGTSGSPKLQVKPGVEQPQYVIWQLPLATCPHWSPAMPAGQALVPRQLLA
jgi:hypothetical protein